MTGDLQLKLAEYLQTIRNNHSSFKLMSSFDTALFPNGVALLSNELTGDCKGKEYRFYDLVHELWKTHQSDVLFIKGDGGTGKTVSLLTFATEGGICNENIPAVYIQMYELNKYCGNSNDCITEYLINNADYSEYYYDIKKLADEKREGKPRFVLLLDGLNEVYNIYTDDIREGIEVWAGKPGVFVVCTSRYLEQEIKNPVVFTLNHLDRNVTHGYLQKTLGSEKTPALNDPVYNILDTPLMLNLYAQTQKYKEMYRASFYDWHEPKTEADIIWNYFQKELARCREIHKKSTSEISFTECAILILWIAPYVCYQMEQLNMFEIPEDELHRYIKEAYEEYLSLDKSLIPVQIRDIEKQLRQHIDLIKPDESGYEQKLFDYLYYLTDSMAIFCSKPKTKIYTLMHQNFRDSMAAMFLKNVIVNGVKESKVPDQLKISISEYVKNYLADLENEDELLKLWELIRKENIAISNLHSYLPENEITLIHNFLRIYGKMTGNDFSSFTFAEMDLRGINLFNYRKENSNLLKLASHDSSVFKNTKLSLDSFKPQGHTDKVNCVAFSHDGRRIVSGSDDKTIRIWDAKTFQQISTPLEGSTNQVNCVAFSHDDRRIVSGSVDYPIQIWDAETHQPTGYRLNGHMFGVNSIAFSPNGQRLVSGGAFDGTIKIWNTETLHQIGLLSARPDYNYAITSVAFSPDGRKIVSGDDEGLIIIWDAEILRGIGSLLARPGYTYAVTSVAFSPDSRRIVSGYEDKTIRIWDAETYHQIGSSLEGHTDIVTCVAFNPDYSIDMDSVNNHGNRRIVSGSYDGTIRIWDAETHQQISTSLVDRGIRVTSVAYSPDGQRIVSGSFFGAIQIWDAETHQQISAPQGGYISVVTSVDFSPDSRRIVSGLDDGKILIWDATSYRQISTPLVGHTDKLTSVVFSPDGRRIVSGSWDGTIRIWNTETHHQIGSPLEGHKTAVISVAFSPDGRRIVSGSWDGTIRIWDIETHHQIGSSLEGHRSSVNSVSISPDGKRIISGSDDYTIRIWDAETHQQISTELKGHEHVVNSVAFSPDNRRIASSSLGKTIRIWDAETHQQTGSPLEGHKDTVMSVSFGPDGKRIVSGSCDGTIRIWNAESYQQIGSPLEGHKDTVMSASFSPDGKRIVSGSRDGTIRIWDAESHECIKVIQPLNGIVISGFDFSKAILSNQDREIFRQNRVIVSSEDKQFESDSL